MSDDWKKDLSFISEDGEEHEVGGQKLTFYPVTLGAVFKLRKLAQPIAHSLSILLGNNEDRARSFKSEHLVEKAGGEIRKSERQAASPESLRQLLDSEERAITKLCEVVFDEGNAAVIGGFIADSLRDAIPAKRDPKELAAWVMGLELPTLVDYVRGFVKANAKVLLPLVSRVAPRTEAALAEVLGAEANKKEATPVS